MGGGFDFKTYLRNNWKILSVGGSLISKKSGFDDRFIYEFKEVIQRRVGEGNRFVIVCGGGHKARDDQRIYKERNPASATNVKLDKIGIKATRFNARYMAKIFGDIAEQKIIRNPVRKIITDKPVIFAGGWKPGCSTDYDAVLLAINLGARRIINLTNTDGVYSADPNGKNSESAKIINNISWEDYLKLIPNNWTPGLSSPFDPKASRKGQKIGFEVAILNGNNIQNLEYYFRGFNFVGTIINNRSPKKFWL